MLLSPYETFNPYTNISQAVSLADPGDPAHAPCDDGPEPGGATHHPIGDRPGTGTRADEALD